MSGRALACLRDAGKLIDVSDPNATRLLVDIKSAMASAELDNLKRRTRDGIRRREEAFEAQGIDPYANQKKTLEKPIAASTKGYAGMSKAEAARIGKRKAMEQRHERVKPTIVALYEKCGSYSGTAKALNKADVPLLSAEFRKKGRGEWTTTQVRRLIQKWGL